jgi:hypothetical protein
MFKHMYENKKPRELRLIGIPREFLGFSVPDLKRCLTEKALYQGDKVPPSRRPAFTGCCQLSIHHQICQYLAPQVNRVARVHLDEKLVRMLPYSAPLGEFEPMSHSTVE